MRTDKSKTRRTDYIDQCKYEFVRDPENIEGLFDYLFGDLGVYSFTQGDVEAMFD